MLRINEMAKGIRNGDLAVEPAQFRQTTDWHPAMVNGLPVVGTISTDSPERSGLRPAVGVQDETVEIVRAWKPKTFYLASRFTLRSQMQQIASRLRSIGHQVSSTWHDNHERAESDSHDGGLGAETAKRHACECVIDVQACDALVLFTDQPRTANKGGRHVEFGIALGMRKALMVVGPRGNIFHSLPNVRHFDNAGAFLSAVFDETRGNERADVEICDPDIR